MSREKGPEYLQGDTKRRLDVIVGTIAGTALLPVVAGAAAVSAVDTRSAIPFLPQERVGLHGNLFNVWKIRTIRKSLTQQAPKETHGTFDPRATKVGGLLRQYGVDEIPQILNVINGTMSMVGIRPLLRVDFDKMESCDPVLFQDWQELYKLGRPGVTGPGQLFRHHFKESTPDVYAQSMRKDIDYIENASLQTDLAILARTPAEMIAANLHIIENTVEKAEVQMV